MEISRKLADQIVTAIHEVVKKDVNLINDSGIIIGSTDPKRIGQFHAAGAAAVKENTPVIVDELHPFEGALSGINYPIFLENTAIAAIGITGNPKELHSYGFLITKITEVFLKEQKINEELASKNRALHYLVTALIYNDIKNVQQFNALLKEHHVDTSKEYSVLSVRLEDSSLEPSLRFYFQNLRIGLSAYLYPSEWVTIMNRTEAKRFNKNDFLRQYPSGIFAGEGGFTDFQHVSRSYSNAVIARKHAQRLRLPYCSIHDISIEIILESLPEDVQTLYSEKLLNSLSEKELTILKAYLSHNLSLKSTAEYLNIHKNTLQYQLDRIEHSSGLNPRRFQDAFLLHFALLCQKK